MDAVHALVLHVNGLEDTDRIGRVLARVLPDGTTVALVGTLVPARHAWSRQ